MSGSALTAKFGEDFFTVSRQGVLSVAEWLSVMDLQFVDPRNYVNLQINDIVRNARKDEEICGAEEGHQPDSLSSSSSSSSSSTGRKRLSASSGVDRRKRWRESDLVEGVSGSKKQ